MIMGTLWAIVRYCAQTDPSARTLAQDLRHAKYARSAPGSEKPKQKSSKDRSEDDKSTDEEGADPDAIEDVPPLPIDDDEYDGSESEIKTQKVNNL